MESRLQVKMNSTDSARDIYIKQEEPEDQPHLSKFNVLSLSLIFLLCCRAVIISYLYDNHGTISIAIITISLKNIFLGHPRGTVVKHLLLL